jgi:hypothetical protein
MMIIFFLKAGSFFKLVEVLILSGVKFLLAPPLSFKLGFSFFQTIIVTTIGGILGVIFFFYLSEILVKLFKRMWPYIKTFFKGNEIKPKPVRIKQTSQKPKKNFSRKNKFIVNTRRKYGLWGIAALTPILLSIPLGTFLANKYYSNKKSVLLSLTVSVVCWSLIMSTIYAIFKVKPF